MRTRTTRTIRRAGFVVVVLALASSLFGAVAPDSSAAARVEPSSRWTAGQLVAGSAGVSFVVRPTRTARYLITLGDVTADLALSVSDSTGRVLARSDHTGTRAFEQVLRKLVDGRRYVVRVSSPTRAAARFALRVMPLKSGVYILDRGRIQSYSAVYLNSSDVVGQIVNNTKRWRELPSAPTFRFWSKSGARLAGTGYFTLTRPSLPPRSLTAFTVTFTPRGWWRTSVTLPATVPIPAPRIAPAAWYSLTIAQSPLGGMGFTLTNRTSTVHLSGQARLVSYGLRGQVVDVDAEDWSGQRARFAATPKQTVVLRMAGNQQPVVPVSWVDRAVVVIYG